MLAAPTPGIQAIGTTPDLNRFSNNGISSWSVNGSSAKQTDFLLDGAPNNAVYNQENTVAYVPPIEAVQEFKVMTSTCDAQFGRSGGGTVNISLRSGTNDLHGSAYEFLKRTGLNANTFADNAVWVYPRRSCGHSRTLRRKGPDVLLRVGRLRRRHLACQRNTFQFINAFSFNTGRHFIKIGGELRRIMLDVVNIPANTRGDFNFGNAEWSGLEGFPATGNTFANFLLGLP
jgi:hypothetical protein